MTMYAGHTFQSEAISVEDFRCSGRDGDGNIETVVGTQLCIVRHGFFGYSARGQEHITDSNNVLLLREGLEYQTRHPDGEADQCTVLALPDATFRDLSDTPDDTSTPPEVEWTVRSIPSVTFRKQWSLISELASDVRDPDRELSIEERALEIAAELLAPRTRSGIRRRRAATERAHRDLVESVKELLALRLPNQLHLEDVADEVGWSPFELSRLFRQRTGLPIHRYRRQLRLRTAYGRLAAGEPSIADLAHDLGFASHSHFSDAFRNEFGETPSEARSA